MIGGFGEAGSPDRADPRADRPGRDRPDGHQQQHRERRGRARGAAQGGRVTKVICSFPRTANSTVFPELYREGFTELELVPQGTLAERIRAGARASPRSTRPTAVGTPLAEGKESREFDGREYLLEHGLTGGLRAHQGAHRRRARQRALQQDRAELRADPMAMAARVDDRAGREVVEPGGSTPSGRHARDLRGPRRRGRRAGARVGADRRGSELPMSEQTGIGIAGGRARRWPGGWRRTSRTGRTSTSASASPSSSRGSSPRGGR
jgi:3-oxoadipate CoA-transferase alpha subunit